MWSGHYVAQEELEREVAGWVVIYSITDKSSFVKASEHLVKLQEMSLLRGKAVALVANKCELVRSRAVPIDGEWSRSEVN